MFFTKYLLKRHNKKEDYREPPTSRMVVVMVVVVQVTQWRPSPAIVLQMQGLVV